MQRALGPLILTIVLAIGPLAGCGSDAGADEATDRPRSSEASSPSDSPPPVGNGTVEFTPVALVSETAAGGKVGERATVLDDEEAVAGFAQQFRADGMAQKITTAFTEADVPDDQALVGAVVAIGCDAPPGVTVHSVGDALEITPMKITNPHVECFAAVTTVALVMVDADLV